MNCVNLATVAPQDWSTALDVTSISFSMTPVSQESMDAQVFPDLVDQLYVYQCPNLVRVPRGLSQISRIRQAIFFESSITSIADYVWPETITAILLHNNNLTSLAGAHFPPYLLQLSLNGNMLRGRPSTRSSWPQHMTAMSLSNQHIDDISGERWPQCMSELYLEFNDIATIEGQSW